jgi:hypothetical protein
MSNCTRYLGAAPACDRLSNGLVVRDSDGRHFDRAHETTIGAARDWIFS